MLKAFLLAAALMSGSAGAFESRWVQGLQLRVEPVEDGVSVGGLRFQITRASGRDVPELARRILIDWSKESGPHAVRLLHQGNWSLLSRIFHGRSEVVQWRELEHEHELLWSSTELQEQARRVQWPGYQIAGCRWSLPVEGSAEGTRFLQSTGNCRIDPSATIAAIETALRSSGWRSRRTSTGFSAANGARQLQVQIIPELDARGSKFTAVMMLEIRPSQPVQ